ncbi:MAG: chromate resistance protein [Acidobacteriota bacterium]|nr:chromate resistance protein [Acidobacteriota bacterium]
MPLSERNWILFIHQLPAKPTNLRVRVWRKLQRLGAVAIKNSVYVLPSNEKTEEDFQWLKQEIETAGGESSVFRAASIEGATDAEIIEIFRRERDAEFEKLTAQFDTLTGAIKEQARGGHLTAERAVAHEIELNKLHQELERIIAIDFFSAKGRGPAQNAYKRCRKTFNQAISSKANQKNRVGDIQDSTVLSRADYQGKRWVTRRNMHIDRVACGWLIKRFIDKRPRFYFVSEGESVENGIRFDMLGAEFTHVGEDCMFETLLKRFGLTGDKALCEIAEIVHDIDLKDNKFNRLEASGFDSIVRGLSVLLNDDRKLLNQCSIIFDGLYEKLNQPLSEIKF